MKHEPLLHATFDGFLKRLYEHDAPALKKPAVAIKKKSGKKTKSGTKYGGKKKPAREKTTEYKAVFSSRRDDYAAQAGHEAAAAQKKYESAENFTSLKPPALNLFDVPAEKAESKEMLYQMITGKINESLAYAQELQKTIDYGMKQHADKSVPLLKLEYDNPVFINNQWTHQRIFIQNSKEGSTVYDLTTDKSKAGSLEAKVRYDQKFNTVYFDSLNNVRDGKDQAYWEVWVNGHIVEEALDRKQLKKGDMIEWRLANEREQGCGGGGYRPEALPGHEVLATGGYQRFGSMNTFALLPSYGKPSFSYGSGLR